MKLLHVDSSVLGTASVSRLLSADIVARERDLHPDLAVIRRDLAATPIPHLAGPHLQRPTPPADQIPPHHAADLAVLDEFLAADIVVIGAPMYNFGVSSQLKAWIDRLAVPGKTFRYGESGPEGLCKGKRIIIASSRGGAYGAGTPMAVYDHQEAYLRSLFGFLGADVTVIHAENVARGDAPRQAAIDAAKAEIAALVA